MEIWPALYPARRSSNTFNAAVLQVWAARTPDCIGDNGELVVIYLVICEHKSDSSDLAKTDE